MQTRIDRRFCFGILILGCMLMIRSAIPNKRLAIDATFVSVKKELLGDQVLGSEALIYSLVFSDFDKGLKVLNSKADEILYSDRTRSLVVVVLKPNSFSQIRKYVKYFDIRLSVPSEESFISDFDRSIHTIAAIPYYLQPYLNLQATISVKENEADSTDIDLINKVMTSALSSGKVTRHATDMATIIAGHGNTYYTSEGVLSNANISTTSFLNLFPDEISYFIENDISVQNHSYGLGIEDYYGLEAQAYDQQVYENPEIVHVFSSGNLGGESAIFSPYSSIEGHSNLSGTFKHAKNVLTIGGVDSFGIVSAGSSFGPAYDGRIKPELVAYGYGGTSEAAAITSGCVAVVANGLIVNGFNPTAAAVKAVLVAGADDLGAEGPDFQTGFGKINMFKSLTILHEKEIIQDTIASNQVIEYDLEYSGVANFDFVISWLDPASEIDNERALINDLDIEVIDSEGQVFRPFQMKYLPEEIENGIAITAGRDSINNIEKISGYSLNNLKVRVKSKNLFGGKQEFTIAYNLKCETCEVFEYPYYGSNIENGSALIPRVSSLKGERFSSFDYFTLPDRKVIGSTISTKPSIQFRDTSALLSIYTVGSFDSSPPVSFTVSEIPKITPAWQCGDSILIAWDKKSYQKSFELLELQGEEMVVIDSTSENYFVVQKKDGRHYVAIREKITDGFYSPNSLAIDLNTLSLNCFFNQFLYEEIDGGLRLNLELSSLALIQDVSIEKEIDGHFIEINRFGDPELSQSFDDLNLWSGNNVYRAVIHLQDGRKFLTDKRIYFYVPKDEIAIFPTLFDASEGIQIIQANFQEAIFYLYNASGAEVIREEIFSDYDYVDTFDLSTGVYFFVMRSGKTILKSGKLFVHSN